MKESRNDKIRHKIRKWGLVTLLLFGVLFFSWKHTVEYYEPSEATVRQLEIDLYQKRKALYLELRPDSTNFERTLTKDEIDKLRTLTTILNQSLSHQFDYYKEGQSYKDYNHHIVSNLDFHIDELSIETNEISSWLKKNEGVVPIVARLEPIVSKWAYVILAGLYIFTYGWEYLEKGIAGFKEGYHEKDTPKAENERIT